MFYSLSPTEWYFYPWVNQSVTINYSLFITCYIYIQCISYAHITIHLQSSILMKCIHKYNIYTYIKPEYTVCYFGLECHKKKFWLGFCTCASFITELIMFIYEHTKFYVVGLYSCPYTLFCTDVCQLICKPVVLHLYIEIIYSILLR